LGFGANGARRSAAAAPAAARGEEEEREAGGGAEWSGLGRGAASRPGVGGRASTTPAYGRHVASAGWSEAGAARGRERVGEAGRAAWLGRKGGGSAQQRLSPFSFFLNFFSPKSLNKTFEAFTNLFRDWSKKKNYSP